ncbi:MAG TPA: ABC transporter substrate binding protein [Pyrinomonadaceae bacterium]|nr:ABC transporter substrate binding protein [Pyrinomonadaceae bacterium]
MIAHRQLRLLALALLSWAACLVMLSWPTAAPGQANNRAPRILVLYWDNKDFPGNIKFDESFKATLLTYFPGGLEYYPEYFETTRFPGQDQVFFRDYLSQKYRGRTIDIVVATADAPLNFLIANSAELFPNAPIVFVANDPPGVNQMSAAPGMTGLVHQSTHRQTLELALQLHPNTKQVFVISGSRERDKRFENVARKELAGFENRVQITYLTDLPLNELVSKTASAPANSIALYLWQQAVNEQGRLLESYEVVGRIAPSSAMPIYGLGTTNLGQGIVGGYLTGAQNNGKRVAEICTSILNGTPVRDIPVAAAPSLAMFDARELKRWGIDESRLPAGSIVSFRQFTFWDQYKWYIVLVLAALLAEAALIARLLVTQSKRRQAEQETERLNQVAEQAHRRLQEIVSNVPGVVWETVVDPETKERKTTFISDYVRTMLGYTPEEWLAQPPGFGMRIMLEEDREAAWRATRTSLETGADTVCEYRWRSKDGRIVWVESHLSPILNQSGDTRGLRGVSLDITERKLAEEAVRKTEQKDRAIYEAIPDLMFLQTRDGVYLDLHYSNPANLLVPPKEYLGKNMREILPPDLTEKFSHLFRRAIETRETQILEYELTVSGEHRWYESRLVCCGENILSVVRDITESREAELALAESERRLRLAQEAARVGTWEWHVPTGESVWSDMIWQLLGLKPGDGVMHVDRFVEFIHPDDRERVLTKVNEVIANGDEYDDEFRIIRADGEVLWLSSQGRVLRGPDRTPERMLGVNVDITKRKAAEETAHQTQQKDAAILNAIPDLMFLQSRDGVFLDYHANREQDLFVPASAFMGKNMGEVLPAELAEKFFDSFARLKQDSKPQIVEYSLPINGTERWYECRVVRSGENFLSVVRDITEQRNALFEQRQSEEKFAKAFRANPQPMALTIMETGRYLDVNEAFLAVSGYRRDEVIGHTSLELNIWQNADARSNFVRQVEEKGAVVNAETVLQAKDGALHILLTSAEVVELGGERCLLAASSDITERKKALDELRESEERFATAFRANPQPMTLTTLADGRFLDVNPAFLAVTGYRRDEVIGQTAVELGIWETPGFRKDFIQRLREVGAITNLEARVRAKDGALRLLLMSAELIELGGQKCVLVASTDITERKRTEEALHESEERYRTLFESIDEGFCVFDLIYDEGGRVVDFVYRVTNPAFERQTGWHNVVGVRIRELAPNLEEYWFEKYAQVAASNVPVRFMDWADVLKAWYEVYAFPVGEAGSRTVAVIFSDVSERVRAEQTLQESEARFRNMADTAPVLIWISDTDNRRNYVNQQWLDFTGRAADQELGDGWTAGIHSGDIERTLTTYADAFDRREPFKLEYQLRRADGAYRWIFDTGTPRFSATGEFLGYIGSCVDITNRKESEQALIEAHEQLVIAHKEVSRLKNELEAENIYLREELRADQMVGEMVGESDAIKYVVFKVNHVAVTDSTVLITGETGTGKELVARAIHKASLRNDRPFVTVNCATLPGSLIESELFGYEKGAFTGAAARKLGRFELANNGTIFLDEIGELPLESQVKLLRVLQEGEIERLGGGKAVKVDVRIIAATNRNLKHEIEKGTFREDLWYRLNVFPITVPPLRQRKEDIPLLVEHFVRNYAKKIGKSIRSISPRSMENLEAYMWPGNIRELANVIERAVIYTQGDVLHVVDLSESAREQAPTAIKSLEQIEREYILYILEQTGWRIEGPRGAAKLLGLNPSTLRTRMIKLGIHKQSLTAGT